ncbi:asc1-like protein [Stylonychia lemnae]|uniref:Asc1-like protein n=1 Tax=Stylonychia lemnae TaxID=5949 RepID=A0A077ZVY6_STYLE|nr:asc1-like protein [Stylonychia lemnae]|eukprot:CDW74039.1 asc1-like protein [Stylonychia lemnae]
MEIKDYLFYFLALVAFPISIYQGVKLREYVNYIKDEKPDCTHTNPQFLQLFFGTWVVIINFMIPVQFVAKSLFLKVLPQKKFPIGSSTRDTKAQIIAERVFRFFVYCGTSLALFWNLKQSNFMHKGLMGSEENPQYFTNYPCQQLPNFIDDLYVIKLSYHTFEMVYNCIAHRHRRDFSEFLLHHIITIALVGVSYCTNCLPVGTVIMLIMDGSDIFVALFKMCVDVNEIVQNVVFGIMASTWFYSRIYFFPIYVMKPFYDQAWFHEHPVAQPVARFLIVFLGILQVLNVFWFYLMITGLIRRLNVKKYKKDQIQFKVE